MYIEGKCINGKSFDFSKIDEIVANHENSAVNIIAILQDIQEYYHYLPRKYLNT